MEERMAANNLTSGRSLFKYSPLISVIAIFISFLLAIGYWNLYDRTHQRENLLKGEIEYLKSLKLRIEKKSYMAMDSIDQLQKQYAAIKSALDEKSQDLRIMSEESDNLEKSLLTCQGDVAKLVNGSLVPVSYTS